jgi:hypothetical protein
MLRRQRRQDEITVARQRAGETALSRERLRRDDPRLDEARLPQLGQGERQERQAGIAA